jgi:hypothetical protein
MPTMRPPFCRVSTTRYVFLRHQLGKDVHRLDHLDDGRPVGVDELAIRQPGVVQLCEGVHYLGGETLRLPH